MTRRRLAPPELTSAVGSASTVLARESLVIFASLRLGPDHQALQVLWIEETLAWNHPLTRHEEPVGRLLVSAQGLVQLALLGRAWLELGEIEIQPVVGQGRSVAM